MSLNRMRQLGFWLCLAAIGTCVDAANSRLGFLTFRVCALDWMEAGLVFESAGKVISVLPPRHTRTQLIEALASPTIAFFPESPPNNPGVTRCEPAAVATIPAGLRRPLLLFEQAPSRGEGYYNVFVVEDSWTSQPAGSVRVVNLSTLQMAARVARKDLVIEPGREETATITELEATHFSAKVALNGPDGWKVDYDTVQQVVPRMRYLLVCRAVPKAAGAVGLNVALLRDFEPNSAQLQR